MRRFPPSWTVEAIDAGFKVIPTESRWHIRALTGTNDTMRVLAIIAAAVIGSVVGKAIEQGGEDAQRHGESQAER